ncbi:molybdopterin-dependent oxidoreductase [Mycolicibacterium sp.]|uniref:molybdopterin-dependent oxidoreductase n=1 Tax=Mycolicibacterium sp. TaxID=2320850 RepID=UPI001A283887|nr:molybdopterin-dependent oxidoreductase [Mycolicibacterium sp.]MBJ7339234.1 molybdopterin-dependent oxidoreductase [Mycolicibacterium sp.]
MRIRSTAYGAAALLVIVGVVACGSNDRAADTAAPAPPTPAASSAPATTGPPSNPYGANSIDPPAPGEPILTVTGGTAPLALTLDGLNALGNTTITVDEPFVKKRQTFSGVPLAAVLAKAGIPNGATIKTVALNDYQYSSAVGPMVDSQALIATTRDGGPIPYDQGGPTRMIFPDGTPLSSVLDAWNWSLTSISVTSPSSGSP